MWMQKKKKNLVMLLTYMSITVYSKTKFNISGFLIQIPGVQEYKLWTAKIQNLVLLQAQKSINCEQP